MMPNGNELAKAIYEQALQRFIDQKKQLGDEQTIIMGAMYQKIEMLVEHIAVENEHMGIVDHAMEKGPWVAGGGGFIALVTWLIDMLSKRAA